MYILFEKYALKLLTDDTEILSQIFALFPGRIMDAEFADDSLSVLICSVNRTKDDYDEAFSRHSFDGDRINVSHGVDIRYDMTSCDVSFIISDTAIAEFPADDVFSAKIYLCPYNNTQPDLSGRRIRPDADSFFYPLMVEWFKRLDACMMHCGAVVANGKAVVFSGPPGSGKSTHVLRMLLKGFDFIADDLAILASDSGKIKMMPFREVANVNKHSMERFPELSFLANSFLRGDGKYTVDISKNFSKSACRNADPGLFIRLHPESASWLKKTPMERIFDNMHSMAWFMGRRRDSVNHFWLLSEWLSSSVHFDVSQGYLAERLDDLVEIIQDITAKDPASV